VGGPPLHLRPLAPRPAHRRQRQRDAGRRAHRRRVPRARRRAGTPDHPQRADHRPGPQLRPGDDRFPRPPERRLLPVRGLPFTTLGVTYQQALFGYLTDPEGLNGIVRQDQYPWWGWTTPRH
jgi:hypothetical protein